MATSRPLPEWYDETHYYFVVAGPVESATDGQVHHITAGTLAGLYGLSTQLPNVVLCQSATQALEYQRTMQLRRANEISTDGQTPRPLVIHMLYLDSTGDYSIPQDVRTWQARREALRRIRSEDRGGRSFARAVEAGHGIAASGGSGGPAHASSLHIPNDRVVTVNIGSQGEGAHPGISDDGVMAMRLMLANLVREGAPGVSRAADSMRRPAQAIGQSPIAAAAQAVHDSWVKPSGVPKEGSRSWARVVKKGCVGERGASGDFSCPEYAWGCDHCPVVVERMREDEKQGKALKGNRMHRFWRSKRKAKAKNEIDFNSPTMVGVDPVPPDGGR